MYRPGDILAVYDEDCAGRYEDLYLHPWTYKHNLNVFNLRRILKRLPQKAARWLDLGCGQAWHFSQFNQGINQVGVDLSIAQLKLAAKRSPAAAFIQADMTQFCLPDAHFDLVTSFWTWTVMYLEPWPGTT